MMLIESFIPNGTFQTKILELILLNIKNVTVSLTLISVIFKPLWLL